MNFIFNFDPKEAELAVNAVANMPYAAVQNFVVKFHKALNENASAPSYSFNEEEANLVLNALSQLPYIQVYALIHRIHQTAAANSQTMPVAETKTVDSE